MVVSSSRRWEKWEVWWFTWLLIGNDVLSTAKILYGYNCLAWDEIFYSESKNIEVTQENSIGNKKGKPYWRTFWKFNYRESRSVAICSSKLTSIHWEAIISSQFNISTASIGNLKLLGNLVGSLTEFLTPPMSFRTYELRF